jgi:PAS domain-containing protein
MMEGHKGLKVAIVGGSTGCKAIMDMIFAETLRQLHMEIIAVATTMDYRDLYKLKDLNMILELTGRDDIANEISRTKPEYVRLMDHVAARVFWDVFEIEEERLAEEERVEEALRESEERYRTVLDASPDPVVVYDMKGKVTYINSAFTRIFGHADFRMDIRRA